MRHRVIYPDGERCRWMGYEEASSMKAIFGGKIERRGFWLFDYGNFIYLVMMAMLPLEVTLAITVLAIFYPVGVYK